MDFETSQQLNEIECQNCASKMNQDSEKDSETNSKFSLESKRILIAAMLFIVGLLLIQFEKEIIANLILIIAYFIAGWGVLRNAFNNIRNNQWFDENFLMSISTVGALNAI